MRLRSEKDIRVWSLSSSGGDCDEVSNIKKMIIASYTDIAMNITVSPVAKYSGLYVHSYRGNSYI